MEAARTEVYECVEAGLQPALPPVRLTCPVRGTQRPVILGETRGPAVFTPVPELQQLALQPELSFDSKSHVLTSYVKTSSRDV